MTYQLEHSACSCRIFEKLDASLSFHLLNACVSFPCPVPYLAELDVATCEEVEAGSHVLFALEQQLKSLCTYVS